jgi:hypothetical protein
MKATKEEWLEALVCDNPFSTKEDALNNRFRCLSSGSSFFFGAQFAESKHLALFQSFSWESTSEGHSFWRLIRDNNTMQ